MRIFRKSADRHPAQAPRPTGHAGDDALLAQLASHSDLGALRHWVHYLYVKNEAAARSAAEVIAAAGWGLQRVDVAANGGPEWIVIAEKQAVTTPAAVQHARSFFEGVAATHEGGDYDGWEASV